MFRMKTRRMMLLPALLAAGAIAAQAADNPDGTTPYKGKVHTIPGLI